MTNKRNTTLYTGVTNNLAERMYQHKNKLVKGFTSKYNINKLVYYEEFGNAYDAICREKQLKNWHRQWKIDLIEGVNPDWRDLSESLF